MTDDPLFEAMQALRDVSEVQTDAERFTRQRILFDVRQRQRTRIRRGLFAIPLAALAIGSVAMAATRGYLPEPVQRWVADVTGVQSRPSRKAKTKIVRSTTSAVSVVTPVAPPDVAARPAISEAFSTPIALAPDAAQPSPEPNATRSLAASERSKTPAADSPMTEAEFERYRLAHDAHFVRKDPVAALAAWSDYLAHAPSGRLAVEARYNQALCLLKLGRTAEAKRALAPFVAGVYGSYRQQEARALVATIDADAGH